MTNKELAAQCLIEAANILNDKEEVIEESYGAHGVLGKTLEDMYKKEKAKNDNYEKNSEKKRKMYERAGFGDKVKPVDRTYENDIKKSLDTDNKLKRNNKMYATSSHWNKATSINTNSASNAARRLDNAKYRADEHKINVPLHSRINKRAGMKESIDYIFDDIDFSDILD